MANIIQLRRDIADNWTSADPVLNQGELGMETDTLQFKVGDGSSHWSELDYYFYPDSVQTAADRVQTGLDVIATGADVLLTGADVLLTHADVDLTNADVISTHADESNTHNDAIATAADRVQTGLDVIQTGLDRTATGEDRVQTGLDRNQTGLDVIATAADRLQVDADHDQTALDVIQTAADRVQTGLDASAASSAKDNAVIAQQAAEHAQADAEAAAATFVVDATPVNGHLNNPISSDWSYDHSLAVASAGALGHIKVGTGLSIDGGVLSTAGGSGVSKDIHQDTHGFVVGNVLYLNGATYTKAKADDITTSEVVGIVSAVAAGTDDFTLSGGGYVEGLSGLTAGTVYFLSDSSAGAMTATEPTTEGHISKPIFIADSTTSGYFFNMRGAVIGGGASSYINTFVNADLTAGVLTVNHNFGHQYCGQPTIIDNNGLVVIPDEITYTSTTAMAVDISSQGTITGTWRVVVLDSGATQNVVNFASAVEEATGVEAAKASSPSTSREMIINLKPTVNAAVNKLDILTKSAGAVPDATNPIKVMIPDGNGYTQRTRAAAYLSGTSQFIMADAANYWSKGSLDAEIKTAYVYAIWDGTGIIWALGGYSGFTRVPASTTATDDDFFLLEEGSTYTKAVTEYCVCVGKIRYQYDTGDTPDHTIQATVIDAPQVIWNPKSDYGYSKNLATTNTSGSAIAAYSVVSVVVKQSGFYKITGKMFFSANQTFVMGIVYLKTGSSTYTSATLKDTSGIWSAVAPYAQGTPHVDKTVYLNAGDTIHLGGECDAASGNRIIYGDNTNVGATSLSFIRID